jgi:hypothetical protein
LEIPLTTLQYRLRRAEDWATETALNGYQIGSENTDSDGGIDGRFSALDLHDGE